MAMRETVGSLRAYFVAGGLLSAVFDLFALYAQPFGLGTAFSLADLGLAVTYVYAGIQLKALLNSAPRRVRAIVLVGGALTALRLVICLVLTAISGFYQAVIGLLITGYIYNNLCRISSEAATRAPPD